MDINQPIRIDAHQRTDLRTRIQNRTEPPLLLRLLLRFQNIDENVATKLQKLRTHPWIPQTVAVRGFVSTSLAAISAKSRMPDHCPYNPPPIPSPRRLTNVEGSEAKGHFSARFLIPLLPYFVASSIPTAHYPRLAPSVR